MLSRENLPTAEAVFSLGLVIARALQAGKPITIFFNDNGHVELALHEEVLLDTVGEEEAVEQLMGRAYRDEQILAYLAGRRARMGV